MISVKEAIDKAGAFTANILGPERATGLQLEEVELGSFKGKDAWQITLSMRRPNPFDVASNSAIATLSSYGPRDYKIFMVDRETGDVLSMTIRELASVE
jgi:hypothetical protein